LARLAQHALAAHVLMSGHRVETRFGRKRPSKEAMRLPSGLHALTFAIVAAVLGRATSAGAAGLMLYETGAPDLGTASAGRAAMAADASTAASNPAGMTLLGRTQLMAAGGAIIPVINFERGGQTSVPGGGGGGGNAGVPIPLGGFFYVYRLSDRVRLGFDAGSNFGLAEDYGKQWVGRYYVTKASILTGQFNPSIAYLVSDWLSVGAGFSFVVGRLYDEAKINNVLPKVPDGGLEIESWDEAFGGNVGFLITPLSKLRLGLTYASPVDFKFGFRPHTTGLGPGLEAGLEKSGALGAKVNLRVTEPQQMMASLIFDLTPTLALMADIGWQNWSQFGQTTLGISATNQRSIAVDLHFSDTIHLACGEQYRIAERWLWSAGFAYDSAPVSEANRFPTLPLDRNLRFATGIQYFLNRDITIGAAYEYLNGGNDPFDVHRGPLAGRVQGDFSANFLNLVGINVNVKL